MRRSYLAFALALAMGACSDAPTSPGSPSFDQGGPQGNQRYIVRFRDTESAVAASSETDRLVATHNGRLAFRYGTAIKGFAGEFSAKDIAALARESRVIAVEADQIAHAIGTQPNPPSWGLDRIDQTALPLSASYTYGATGSGVRAYIIDTGIRFTHVDFGGRAITGVDEITIGGTANDCAGHGTHVAGTVGGSTYGVAKGVTLIAVRVLDCTGTGLYSQVIAGVDWVTQQKLANPSIPAVANMSLGGPVSSALNTSVANAIAAGVTFAVAAGNDSTNACLSSPASAPNAITVGATTISDVRSSFSNLGTCLDIFAPGSSITSDYYLSNTSTATASGTSMASPHVAGAAALYLELNPTASPSQVTAALVNNATNGVVSNAGTGSPNKLLYMGFIGSAPPPPPVANFTFSCAVLACSFDGSTSTAQASATYAWAWGDGTSNGSGKTASHSYAAAGTYNVTLTVTDAGGSNSRTQSVTVTVPAPVANFTSSCNGLSCNFDASTTTAQPNATYGWAWGDGTANGSGKTAAHSFAASGTYTVTLTVSDAGGSSAKSQSVTVSGTVNQPPVSRPSVVCVNMTCNFDGSASSDDHGIVAYEWHPTQTSTTIFSTQAVFSYTFGLGATRTWWLLVKDAGGLTDYKPVTFTTPAPGTPAPVANFTFSCTQLACSFDASSSTAQSNATYGWAWGDGTAAGSGKTATHTYGAPGNYSVTLTVTDAGGTNSKTQSVAATPPPPVANYTFSCTLLACSFDASGSTAQPTATYSWAWGDGTANGAGKTATHSFAAPGTFSVTLTVSDAGGTNTKTQAVTVSLPAPVASYTFSCNQLACSFNAGGSTAQPNATYGWAWGDGSANGSGKTPSHTFAAPGTYGVTLTVTDGGGSNSQTQQVTVSLPAPVANFTFSCTQLACSFDASSSTAQSNATYDWAWGDGSANGSGKTPSHTFGAPGNYSVTLTVTDAGGSNAKTLTVSPTLPAPVANYTFSCNQLACSFDASTTTAQSNATYDWAWGDGTANGSGKTPSHTFGVAGTYSVTLTVTDAGGSSTRTQQVTVASAPPPNQPPVAFATVVCHQYTCVFDGTGSTDDQGIVAYEWHPGGPGIISTQPIFTDTFTSARTRTFWLTVRDAQGLTSTYNITFTVPQP